MKRTYQQGRTCAAPGCDRRIHDKNDDKYCTAKHDYWNKRLRAGKPMPDGSASAATGQPKLPTKHVVPKVKSVPVPHAISATIAPASGIANLAVPESALDRYFVGLPLGDKVRIIQQEMNGCAVPAKEGK